MQDKKHGMNTRTGNNILGEERYAKIEKTALEEQFLVLAGEFYKKIEIEFQNYGQICEEQNTRLKNSIGQFAVNSDVESGYSKLRKEIFVLEQRIKDVEDEQVETVGFLKFVLYIFLLSLALSVFGFLVALKVLFN